jgi:cation transport ATPase
MVLAAFGLIAPVQGALLQEAIDVAVILNALRALRDEHPIRAVSTGPGSSPAPITV